MEYYQTYTTDEEGRFVFHGFPGRLYEAQVRVGVPPTPVRSPSIQVLLGQENRSTWRLPKSRRLVLRFVEERDGQRIPYKAIKSINVDTEETGWNVSVDDGVRVLELDYGFLASAQRVTLNLSGVEIGQYDIVENRTIEFSDQDKQAAIVVLRKRLWATFQVEGLDTKANTPVGLKTYILDAETGKRLSGAGPGREFRLGPGRYLLAFWQSGYRLAQHEAVVTKEETVNLSIPLQEAPELRGVLLDVAGEPVHEQAALRLRYGDAPYLADEWARPDEKGAFRMPVDDRLAPVLWVQTQNAGSRLIKVTPETLGEGLTIRLQACRVTGQATVDEQVAGEKRLGLVWTPEAFPRLPVAACPIDGGRYEVRLEPGRYACYLARGGEEVIRLDDVIIGDEPEKQLPPITLTQERWDADKRPMADHLDRF